MGMQEGRGTLRKSVKELMMHWAETRSQWTDSNAHQFEERFLAMFNQDAKQAVSGMDAMAQIIQRIKSDCGTD
jgi:ABC-type xylose transport system substrate-binding protein